MTITFPRALPSALISRLSTCLFDLVYMQETAPTRGGLNIARDLGPALWRATMTSALLTPANFKIVEAALDSLNGSINPFYAYDLARQYAIAYPNGYSGLDVAGGGAWDGTGNLTAIASDSVTVSMDEIPASFAMSQGDYLGFLYNSGASLALHRCVYTATADSDGNISVEVRPPVRAGWTSGTSVALSQVPGKFLIEPKSVKKNLQPAGYGSISFTGTQTLG